MPSKCSPDGAQLAERNPGSAHEPRIPASGPHPGFYEKARPERPIPARRPFLGATLSGQAGMDHPRPLEPNFYPGRSTTDPLIPHACKPAFGANAILVVCLPYLMIHFPKPWLEATGAIFFGLFLGMLALRTRSIWGGVLVHVSIALSMDLLALLQTHGLPVRWWP